MTPSKSKHPLHETSTKPVAFSFVVTCLERRIASALSAAREESGK